MLIDFRKPILDLKGNEIKKTDKDGNPMEGPEHILLLVHVCQDALTNSYADEQSLSGSEKFKRYSLALKIDSAMPVDISAPENAELQKVVAKSFGPLVVGRVYDILEKKDAKDETAKT